MSAPKTPATHPAAQSRRRRSAPGLERVGRGTAEAMLRESGERYRQLIEVAPVAIFVHADWRIVLANPAMVRLFRAERAEQLVGREVLDLLVPGSRELVRERIRQLYETPQSVPLAELEYVGLDGTHFSAEATAVSFTYAGRPAAQVVARDITDRKAAERALRASEQRFRALTELSSDWYWEQDAELRFVRTEGRTRLRAGISEEEHIGKRRWELPGTEMLGQSWDEHKALLAARAPFQDLMLKRTAADGAVFHVSVSGEPYFDAAGKFAGYRGVAKDVTARCRAEDALREAESRLRVTLDSAPAAICFYDREERIAAANAGYADITEKPLGQILGRSVRAAAGDPAYARAKPYIDRALAGETAIYERRRSREDGSMRDLRIENVPYRDASGQVVGACTLIIDISDLKKTQRALQASEARFRALTKLSSDWYWEQDEEFRFTFFSADLERIAGIPTASGIGKTRWDFPTIGVTVSKWQAHQAALRARAVFYDFEYQRANSRGETIWLSTSGVPIFDEDGRFRGYRGVGRNITSRKEAEMALRQSSERYETPVDSVEGIVWEADAATFIFTFVSRQAERLLGYPARQWLEEGDFWRRHTHPDDVGWTTEFCLRATAEKRNHEFEYRMVAADGRVVWLRDLVSVVVEDGDVVKLRGIMVDVTDRRNAEQAMRESEERFRGLTALSTDFYWETDSEHRFLTMTSGPSAKGSVPDHTYLGKRRWEIPYAAPGEEGWRSHRECVENRQPIRGFRLARQQPGGEIRHYEVDGDPLFDASGSFRGYRGVGRDVTERLGAEHALRESEQRIRALLQRLTHSQEAERRRIAADLHDLVGQNLTALGVGLETLRAELSKMAAPQHGTTFDEMARLLKETIDAVRQTMSDLRPAVLDDYGLLAALESHARQLATRTGLPVAVQGQPLRSRPAARVELALFRIAQEALANAVKHARASRACVLLSQKGGFLQIAIEDDGVGFAHSDDGHAEQGGGWGLPLMRERAAEAGGTLHIEFPARGTRVIAKVPHVDSPHPG